MSAYWDEDQIALQLRAYAALAKYLSSGLSTHVKWVTTSNTSSSIESNVFDFLRNLHSCVHAYTHMHKILK